MTSAFQNCAKFEDWTYFGKTHYPKENIIMLSYSVSARKSEMGHPRSGIQGLNVCQMYVFIRK